MATKKQHFEAPRLSDFDLEILPLAKKLVYVQKKHLLFLEMLCEFGA